MNTLTEMLRKQTIPQAEFFDAWGDLKNSIGKVFPERASQQALVLLSHLRVIFLPNEMLDRLQQLPASTAIVAQYVNGLTELLRRHQRESEWFSNAGYLEVPLGFGYHRILDYGRKLRIHFAFGLDNPSSYFSVINVFVLDVEKKDDAIPVLVIDRDTTVEEYLRIKNSVNKHKRLICIWSRLDFERILYRPNSIRDEVLHVAERISPDAGTWHAKVFPDIQTPIPTLIRPFERDPLPSHSTGTSHRKCLEMNPRHGRLRD